MKLHRQNICNEINRSIDKCPKTFWSLINKLNNASQGGNEDCIPQNDFLNHFKHLNTEDEHFNQCQTNIAKNFQKMKQNLDIDNSEHALDGKITQSEILKAVKSLKNGKVLLTI